ncbi:MAG TPA: hypothetical protein VJM11_02105 [Nevskiaceae bacterium]|nr:hypothetical protein [Nevskiaceae bacterium]
MILSHRLRARAALAAATLCCSLSAAAVTPSDYAMPYVSNADESEVFKGITLVNSANFAQTSQLVAATVAVGTPHIVNGADVDGTGLHDTRPHTLVWAQANRWMRAPLRGGLAPTPVRFSNEAAANTTCEFAAMVIYRDFAAPLTSALYYQLPGTNASCGDEDDVIKRVDIDDASGTAPTTTALENLSLHPIYKTDGKLAAIYTLQGSSVLRIASDLTTITTVRAGVSQFEVIGSLPDTTVIALMDGNLERIRPAGTVYANPLRRPKDGYTIEQAVLHQGEVFFTEDAQAPGEAIQTRVTRIAANAASPAVLMLTLKQAAFLSGFTTGRMIYTVGTAEDPEMSLYSFPKDGSKGSAPQTRIHKAVSPNFITVMATHDDNVFFNVTGFGFTPEFEIIDNQIALVKTDLAAAVKNYGAHSQFLGGQITDSGDGALEEQETYARLLLGTKGVSGSFGFGLMGPKLHSLDPATVQATQITDLADHFVTLPAFGFGAGSIGGLLNFENEQGDVYAYDLVGLRFRLLSDGTARNEFPIF